ncbi:kinase, PfkB family [Hallella bergensis DSM 17361]|uniref:Kinase, PfkB family n=1 Tax=Hallella bergensis DSM 17361 TaxID=585502 RepID=D1PWF3_9BACT|nr:carbohydrate kinase [Hallella bergensis]EFA44284.1 kinase, PfkB family [Hallella bergensis DSM 17361]
MKRYVVGLGEALWDVLPTERKLGGAPANFAYHVAQTGFDAIAISAVGNDTLGDETLQCFKSKQLDYIMPRVEFPTGTVQVTVDAAGIPLYEIKRNVAWDHIPLTTEIIEVAKNCKAVCFGSLAQREDESRNTIEKFLDSVPNDCLRIFDINIRQQFYTKQLIENSLKKSDILKINDEELELIAPMLGYDQDSSRNSRLEEHQIAVTQGVIHDYNLQMVVLTCGTNGSYIITSNEVLYRSTPKVHVVDTVGAGDSFTGAFVASLLKGDCLEEAHRKAVDTSAFVCTKSGAMPSY